MRSSMLVMEIRAPTVPNVRWSKLDDLSKTVHGQLFVYKLVYYLIIDAFAPWDSKASVVKSTPMIVLATDVRTTRLVSIKSALTNANAPADTLVNSARPKSPFVRRQNSARAKMEANASTILLTTPASVSLDLPEKTALGILTIASITCVRYVKVHHFVIEFG